MEACNTTQAVQHYLDKLDGTAETPHDPIVRALLARSTDRLRLLCTRLLYQSYPRLTREPAYLDADDLLSAVVERLLKALRNVRPQSVRQFFALANKHIRWELNDLARKIDQQHAVPLGTLEPVAPSIQTTQGETHAFRRILDAIDALPDDEREVFEFIRIQGMSHAEAAELLGVSEKTVQRRIRRSVLLLADSLRDLAPSPALLAADGPDRSDTAPS